MAQAIQSSHDPIRKAIRAHGQAVSKHLGTRQIDAASELLLETMPTTVEGVIALLLHVHDTAVRHGEYVFPMVHGETFACRMLAHAATALIRLRA